jgi:hypothetical protein
MRTCTDVSGSLISIASPEASGTVPSLSTTTPRPTGLTVSPPLASSSATGAKPIDISWHLSEFPDAARANVFGVVEGGPGFVAVGMDLGSGSLSPSAAAWTSADGSMWSRATFSGLADFALSSVAVLPDGSLIASTALGAGCPVSPEPIRSSGSRAMALPGTAAAFPTDTGCPAAFAANTTTSVAVGYGPETIYAHDISPAMWWSDDNGATWQRATVPELAGPFFVAAVPFGFVAIDALGSGPEPHKSPYTHDGRSWLLPSSPPVLGRDVGDVHTTFAHSVAAGSGGLIMYDRFTSSGIQTLVWSSTDGDTWTQVRSPLFLGAAFRASTNGPAGTVAVGWLGSAIALQAAAWTTQDGVNWLQTTDLPSGQSRKPDRVAMSSTHVVALDGSDRHGVTAWVGTIVPATP